MTLRSPLVRKTRKKILSPHRVRKRAYLGSHSFVCKKRHRVFFFFLLFPPSFFLCMLFLASKIQRSFPRDDEITWLNRPPHPPSALPPASGKKERNRRKFALVENTRHAEGNGRNVGRRRKANTRGRWKADLEAGTAPFKASGYPCCLLL